MPVASGMSERDRLAWTILGEAGRESRQGQDAVAHNILNRYYSGKFGSSVSGVIMAPGQYSMWNDVTGYAGGKGGNSASIMSRTSPERFAAAQGVADDAMSGRTVDPTGGSLNYYNPNTASPSWGIGSPRWTDTGAIGNHTFGVAGGQPYDVYSNPDDPRGNLGSKVPYDNFSPSGMDLGSQTSPGAFSDYMPYSPPYSEPAINVSGDVKPGYFDDFGGGAIGTTTDQDGTQIAPSFSTDPKPGMTPDDFVSGETVSNPQAGAMGIPASIPLAIVSAANQEAKTAASAAKTQAEATLGATKAQTASDAKLQSEQQGFAANWAVRIFLFIVGAIFIAGGLFLFGGQQIFQAKQA